jgi:hypothetical protein
MPPDHTPPDRDDLGTGAREPAADQPVVVQFTAPRRVDVVETTPPRLGAADVRVRTLYSGISAGTELTAYRGSNV